MISIRLYIIGSGCCATLRRIKLYNIIIGLISSMKFTEKSPGFSFVHEEVEVCVDCACVEQESKHATANDVSPHHCVLFPVEGNDVTD